MLQTASEILLLLGKRVFDFKHQLLMDVRVQKNDGIEQPMEVSLDHIRKDCNL